MFKKDRKETGEKGHNILIISPLIKEVNQLIRCFFAQSPNKTEQYLQPLSVSYKINKTDVITLQITCIDGNDSQSKRQQYLKQWISKMDSAILVFLFSYSDLESLKTIIDVYFKEIDSLAKEEEYFRKITFLLLANVDSKSTKKMIQSSRRKLNEIEKLKEKTCIEYNTKMFLNIKEIFTVLHHLKIEEPKRKSVFPALFKKKSTVNLIPIHDKYFKNLSKKKSFGNLEEEENQLLQDTSEDTHKLTNVDDPTENDLLTSATALTEEESDTLESEIQDLETTITDIENDSFTFNSEIE